MAPPSGEPFCTSPARFAILGRSECEQRHYQTTLFTPIATRSREGLVVELEEDDFLEPGIEPRRLQPAAGDDRPVDRLPPRRGLAPASAPTRDRQ